MTKKTALTDVVKELPEYVPGKVTPEQQKQKDKLAKELKKKQKRKKLLYLKLVVMCTILIETLDELESHNSFRYQLKRTGKAFMRQMLIFIKQVFDINDEQNAGVDYIAQKSKEIDEILK